MSFEPEAIAGPSQSADVTPSELTAGAETTEIRRTAPIGHGSGVSFVLDDGNAQYDAWRDTFREAIGEPKEDDVVDADIDFMPDAGDYVWIWKSTPWKAGQENANGNWKRWYDYQITLRRRSEDPVTGEVDYHKPPTSVNVIVEPQKEGMTYEDGNDVSLPYGEGTRIRVRSTYAERGSQVVSRGLSAIRDVLEARAPASVDVDELVDASNIKQDSALITKAEAYLRFDIDRKHAAIRTVDKSENLIDVGGDAEITTHKKRQSEGWLEAKTSSDRWDRLGLNELETTVTDDGREKQVRVERELKVYQSQHWHELDRGDHAHHPKIEASTAGRRNPHISEWGEVMDGLRELVLSHCEWAGITDDDLIGDDYFKPSTQPTITVEHPEGRREDLRRYYNRFEAVVWSEALKAQTTAAYDIISVVAERHGATYQELEAATGFSRSNLDYHVGRLKETGLLTTIGNPAIVCFDAEYLYDMVEELVDEKLAPHFDEETLAARRLGREERAEERREARENGTAPGTDGTSDENDVSGATEGCDDDADADQDDGTGDFVYLDDWRGTPQMIMDQLVDDDHPRTERDVRVRRLDPGG